MITLPKRVPEFDGVRGIAVLLVMLFHLANPAMPGGWIGVDIFFVLSGFLITTILLGEYEATGAISLKVFYVRRALRLLPAVTFLLISYATFLFMLGYSLKPTVTAFIATQFYVVNWILAFNFPVEIGPFYHFWSLSTEEQFYLLWPAALIGLFRLPGKRHISLILCGVIVLITGWRLVLLFTGVSSGRLAYGLDTRASMLLIGCLLALNTKNIGRVPYSWIIFCALGMGLMAAGIQSPGFPYYSEILIAVLIASVLAWLLQTSPENVVRRMLRFQPLVWTGQISYGLYLWHVPIQHHFFKQHWPLPLAAGRVIALTFIAAAFSFYVIERPFLRLKGKIESRDDLVSSLEKYPQVTVETGATQADASDSGTPAVAKAVCTTSRS